MIEKVDGFWKCEWCSDETETVLNPNSDKSCRNCHILRSFTIQPPRKKGYTMVSDISLDMPPQSPENAPISVLEQVSAIVLPKTQKQGLLSLSEYLKQYKKSSKTEYERYKYLWACLQDGTIQKLKCQPSFTLFTGIRPTANILRPRPRKIQDIGYTADFEYIYQGIRVIEDVKGAYGNSKKNRKKGIVGNPIISDSAKLRHKMLQSMYPEIVFKIVTDVNEAIESIRGLDVA